MWGSVKFFHTKLIQPCLHGPCFMHWGKIMLRQNCSHNIGSRKSSKNVLGGTKISFHCNYKAQAKVQKENDYAVRPNTCLYNLCMLSSLSSHCNWNCAGSFKLETQQRMITGWGEGSNAYVLIKGVGQKKTKRLVLGWGD